MRKTGFIRAALLLCVAMAAVSCVKDETQQVSSPAIDASVKAKLVHTSANAAAGSLIVCFGDDATKSIELTASRAGGIATRSGVEPIDAVLSDIGVVALHRVFIDNKTNYERLRAEGMHRWYTVEFDESVDLDKAAVALAGLADIKAVEFDQTLKHIGNVGPAVPLAESGVQSSVPLAETAVFNDPQLGKQWDLINTGDTSLYSGIIAGADVNCKEAWRLCKGDRRVIVAVVDHPVDCSHPDLVANIWTNKAEIPDNGIDDDNNGYVDDIHGYDFIKNEPLKTDDTESHGTHIAGTIAAVNNNGLGVCGIAGGSGNDDGVQIMSCQMFYKKTGGDVASTARAVQYATDMGAAIIQCSYGYTSGAIGSDDAFAQNLSAEKQAIDYFVKYGGGDVLDGGLPIFAAGNDMREPSAYPAAYKDYISVTSTSCDYTPAYYTCYGAGCNIAAPGGDLYQSLLTTGSYSAGILSTYNNGQYGYMQGTSMACPHVSGVAALGLSYAAQLGKKFTSKEFTTLLLTSVNDVNKYCTGVKQYINDSGYRSVLDLSQHKGKMGTGCIDAFQLLMNIHGITCIPIPTGSVQVLDMNPYIGGGNLGLKIGAVKIAAEDMQRLGIVSEPSIFGNKIKIKCDNAGSAIMTVTLQAGTSNTSGISSMVITKDFAIIARKDLPANGGWL